MLRFLFRILSNNEALISKLADSRPMRRAAQFVVSILLRTSSVSGQHKLPSDPKEFAMQLRMALKKYADGLKGSIEDAKKKKYP